MLGIEPFGGAETLMLAAVNGKGAWCSSIIVVGVRCTCLLQIAIVCNVNCVVAIALMRN